MRAGGGVAGWGLVMAAAAAAGGVDGCAAGQGLFPEVRRKQAGGWGQLDEARKHSNGSLKHCWASSSQS